MVDIHSIGAGGGSIAWSEAGALRVGPRSAGADPGPACYGRGGTEPTVTDANVVLGRIDPESFLGGRMKLDAAASRNVVAPFAKQLGMSTEQMAEGILGVIDAKMANAIRTMTISKGIDPREFALIAFGGAGPMHAMFIARELEIRKVIVPNVAGQFSAWGMLHADIRHDISKPVHTRLDQLDWRGIEQGFAEMQRELGKLLREEGVPAERTRYLRYLEMRYVSQEYTLSIPVPEGMTLEAAAAPSFKSAFDELYLQNYGHMNPQEEGVVANIRVEARGLNDLRNRDEPAALATETTAAATSTRPVIFGGKPIQTRFLDRSALVPGEKLVGPAVISELSCTTVVPPGWEIELDSTGNILIQKQEAQA
jgi:N-methylhydantoinase A